MAILSTVMFILPKLLRITQVQYMLLGLHRHEKHLHISDFLEKCLKLKHALKNAGNLPLGLVKYLNFTIFCRSKTKM